MKRKSLSLMIVLSMVISLVCVMPVAVASAQSITGKLLFMSDGGVVQPEVNITGNGKYTFIITVRNPDFVTDIFSAGVFLIDFIDAANTNPNMKVELSSITVPDYYIGGTREVAINKSKLKYGDLEENGNLRLEIYNEYGETKNNPPIDPFDIYVLMGDTMTVTVNVTGLPNEYVSNSTTNYKTQKKTTTKKVEKPIQKVNTKKATKPGKPKIKYIYNPNTKKLKVKWKKVKGATGYQYKIALTKKFKKAKKKSINNKSFSYKLKLNKKYTISVRAYKLVGNEVYYGKWTTKKIKVKQY